MDFILLTFDIFIDNRSPDLVHNENMDPVAAANLALPSKFEFSRAKHERFNTSIVNLSRSRSSFADMQPSLNKGVTDTNEHTPQPKVSRSTQKPHVRKSRRKSSLDRRRARYAR